MPRPRGGVNGIAAFGCFFVWGGEGANIGEPNNVFPDHDVYNPLTDTWTQLPDLPTPVHGVTGAAFVNGLIYMPGGGTRAEAAAARLPGLSARHALRVTVTGNSKVHSTVTGPSARFAKVHSLITRFAQAATSRSVSAPR